MIKQYSLNGLNLIEASAGTGKTHTISHLYLRLLLEKGLEVKQILVVTFTVAATIELRERIRNLIAETLVTASGDDEKILKKALMGFDESTIFTIHSFCERILRENCFESRMLFNTEALEDCSEIQRQIVDDYLRNQITKIDNPPSRAELDKLVKLSDRAALAQFDENTLEDAEQYDVRGRELAELVNNTLYFNNRIKIDEIKERYPEVRWPEHAGVFAEIAALTKQKDFTAAYDKLKLSLTARTALEFMEFYRDRLAFMRKNMNFRSFDDILLDLYHTLKGDSGESLIAAVRQRYSAVMIDECQDTDKVQFEIFNRLFIEKSAIPCFLIGDPKQSIYGFRSADIYSYIAIASNVKKTHSLDTNYRSATLCVDAQNSIFAHMPNPFLLAELSYPQVKASPQSKGNSIPLIFSGTLAEEMTSGIDFYNLDVPDTEGANGKKKPPQEDDISREAVNASSAQIARLLNGSKTGEVYFGDNDQPRELKPSDIAVLVMTHSQAGAMLDKLRSYNIPAVVQRSGNVFTCPESADLMLVLKAIINPHYRQIFNGALLSSICGIKPRDLDLMLSDEELNKDYEEHMKRFKKYYHIWNENGFLGMFHSLLEHYQTREKLLETGQLGERRLTNILQLAELLNETEVRISGMDSLLEWFEEQCRLESNKEHEMRLERDDDAVKIMTVFSSKGLEFPLVFCPFPWSKTISFRGKKDFCIYHNQAQEALIGSRAYPNTAKTALFEELAEIMRLFYVALSRARNKCWVYWNRAPKFNAVEYLLTSNPDLDDLASTDKLRLEQDYAKLPELDAVRFLNYKPSQEQNFITTTEPEELVPPPEPPNERQLHNQWSIASFSSLTRGHYEEQKNLLLSHDDGLKKDDDTALGQQEASETSDFIGFPRGIGPGNFLHQVLEKIDFTLSDPAKTNKIIESGLSEFAITGHNTDKKDSLVIAVNSMLHKVMNTPLLPINTLKLSDLSRNQRLTEMEFHFALRPNANSNGISFPDAPMLEQHWQKNNIPTGFMNGKIDLTFEHDDRFYILDWKSNHLGDNPKDYSVDRLKTAMDASLYNFQYLIYTIALDLWLKQRLPEYSYEKHFGGVFYLFLRGIGHGTNGIFFTRPEQQFLENFKQYFIGTVS